MIQIVRKTSIIHLEKQFLKSPNELQNLGLSSYWNETSVHKNLSQTEKLDFIQTSF